MVWQEAEVRIPEREKRDPSKEIEQQDNDGLPDKVILAACFFAVVSLAVLGSRQSASAIRPAPRLLGSIVR